MEAGQYFTSVREALEADLCALAQSYSPVQWLWYLRRLPDLFDGALATTGPYDRGLMEIMAATSRKTCPGLPREQQQIAFPVTDGVVRRVLRFAATTVVLSDVHSRLRQAGKGMSFEPAGALLPAHLPDRALSDAIALYDQRVAEHGAGLLAPGTRVLSGDHRDGDPLLALVARSLPAWQGVPSWQGVPRDKKPITVWGRYVPDGLSLGNLRALLALTNRHPGQWWQPQLPALVALLQALIIYMNAYTSNGWISLSRYGYVSLRRNILTDMLTRALPMLREDLDAWFPTQPLSDADQVLELLEGLSGTIWPLTPSPVLYQAGEDVLVDFDAATRHLLRLCTIAPPGQGPVVNIRGDHFEETVQDLINESPWCPSPRVPLRGLKPKLIGGSAFTDLDAVGDWGDTLLIVSCKSRPYTETYDAGDHSAVRSVSTLVEGAVGKWQTVLSKLRENPQGANYDVRGYRRILGVVCLPHVPYTPLGSSTEVIDISPSGVSLRMSNSYEELYRWLHGYATPARQ
ncbi:hypothetical protein ACFXDJ_15680 [Streptomyces sp. NPDC059443]|uniref:hypothetical protein n=1 Tax=unclassified Streptomyces TaxID=2593676 RepID=UPI00367E64D4